MHSRDFRSKFQTMLHAFERFYPARYRRGISSSYIGRGACGQNVLHVMFATQRNFIAPRQRNFRTLISKKDLLVAKESSRRNAFLPAKPENVWLGRHALRNLGIVRVKNRNIPLELVFKHAHLCQRVFVERSV